MGSVALQVCAHIVQLLFYTHLLMDEKSFMDCSNEFLFSMITFEIHVQVPGKPVFEIGKCIAQHHLKIVFFRQPVVDVLVHVRASVFGGYRPTVPIVYTEVKEIRSEFQHTNAILVGQAASDE